LLVFLSVFQVKGLKAEEIPRFYQIVCPEPDGSHNYYRNAPQICVKHKDESLVTRYQLRFPGGKKIVGKLEGQEKSEEISAAMFEEGDHELDMWMEDKKGNVIPGTESARQLKIDQNAPSLHLQLVSEQESTIQKQSLRSCMVELKGEDAVSGVAGIYYRVGDGEERYMKGERGFVSISAEMGRFIKAYAIDNAGNTSQIYELAMNNVETTDAGEQATVKGMEIEADQKPPELIIEGIENYSIVGEEVKYVCRVKGISQIGSVEGEIIWENRNGEQQSTEIIEWKEVDDEYFFQGELREEGLYIVCIKVIDVEGTTHKGSRQVIVDKTSPIIRSLTELDGASLGSFQWNYNLEEWINDSTTYTYEVRLDGKLCDVDRVYIKKGKHILEVWVTDAAGNESRATAMFQIVDETPQLTEKEQEKNPSIMGWIWSYVLLIVLGIGGFIWVIREKTSIKREEAR